jgi:hypothetical protein
LSAFQLSVEDQDLPRNLLRFRHFPHSKILVGSVW